MSQLSLAVPPSPTTARRSPLQDKKMRKEFRGLFSSRDFLGRPVVVRHHDEPEEDDQLSETE